MTDRRCNVIRLNMTESFKKGIFPVISLNETKPDRILYDFRLYHPQI